MNKILDSNRLLSAVRCLPLLVAAASLGLPAASIAQGSDRASRELLVELIGKATPSWDQRVLTISDSQAWAPQTTPQRISDLLGDRDLVDPIGRAPDGARLFQSGNAVLRFDSKVGALRYVNRVRAVDASREVAPLIGIEEAQERALRTLSALGLPPDQLIEPRVATQMAGGGRTGSQSMEVKAELYRLVTVQRRLGDLQVLGSEARAVINPKGEIHRLSVSWPQVGLPPRSRLVNPSAVVEQAVEALLNQNTSSRAQVRGRLAYVAKDPRNPSMVVPAVVYAVIDPPTPFIVTIPVAEAEENDDK